jgi:hypothetical protein
MQIRYVEYYVVEEETIDLGIMPAVWITFRS